MLTSLRIQNFRSIRDASVKLGQVNLFIGPNNSGKSNFLKGISWLINLFQLQDDSTISADIFLSNISRSGETYTVATEFWDEISFIMKGIFNSNNYSLSTIIKSQSIIGSVIMQPNIKPIFQLQDRAMRHGDGGIIDSFNYYYGNTIVYKFEPSKYQLSAPITSETTILSGGSNLVSFIFQLSQNYRPIFRRLEDDFAKCVGNLWAISTPADPIEPGKIKLKFFDRNDIGYWAEEVSEGVLYFLAVLCIVHQPDPPKLLLLEEPEKGIHPRRIKEVMGFIFELARLRDIQIILTSHSPYVVDYFADIPECISVFDRENGETVIRNAADLIEQTNKEYAEQGLPPVSYKDSLGEYWLSGFLGGVPV